MNPLVSAEEFAGYLQRDLDRYTADLALAGASGVVRLYCGWRIDRATETFVLDGDASRILTLPTLKLNAVNSVTVEGDELDPDDYQWSESGMLYRAGGWPAGFRNIEVDADHGYSPTPDEVRVVVCAIASRHYNNPDGLRSKTVGAISRTFVLETMRGDLSKLEVELIGGHRLP